MTIDKLIDEKITERLLENNGVLQKINELHAGIDFILSIIISQQKDACEAAGISPETLRRRVLEGELMPLSRDGSRLTFVSLKQMQGVDNGGCLIGVLLLRFDRAAILRNDGNGNNRRIGFCHYAGIAGNRLGC